MAPTADVQLAWLSTALDELPSFLPSSDVFRPLHDSPHDKPQDLSLGGVLLAVDALAAAADGLPRATQARWEELRQKWELVSTRQAAAIERKAAAELPHRLNLWRSYLQDLTEKPSEGRNYAVEVRHRAIIERLQAILGSRAAHKASQLAKADDLLRPKFRPGSFIWDSELKPAYPERPFWYLYGQPAGTT